MVSCMGAKSSYKQLKRFQPMVGLAWPEKFQPMNRPNFQLKIQLDPNRKRKWTQLNFYDLSWVVWVIQVIESPFSFWDTFLLSSLCCGSVLDKAHKEWQIFFTSLSQQCAYLDQTKMLG